MGRDLGSVVRVEAEDGSLDAQHVRRAGKSGDRSPHKWL